MKGPMKLYLSLVALLVVNGCVAHTAPPPPEPPYVVTVTKIPLPKSPPIHGTTVGNVVIVSEDGKPDVEVTISDDDAQALHEAMAEAMERYKAANEPQCKCNKGDPLCSCIKESYTNIPRSELPAK